MSEHKDLTGSQLHEPKGADSASANTVYTSDGDGSGTWINPLTSLKNKNLIQLCTRFDDISAPSSAFIVTPIDGNVVGVYVVLRAGVTVADSTITGKIAGVPITGLSIVVTHTGSAAGSVYYTTAITDNNTLTSGQAIEIITDGGSTTTVIADITVAIDVS